MAAFLPASKQVLLVLEVLCWESHVESPFSIVNPFSSIIVGDVALLNRRSGTK
jgi:hypothetical protein